MSIHVKIGRHEAEYVIATTNAQESYDGFGTFTVNKSGDDRVVAIQSEHLEWQTTRYRSGLYSVEIHEDWTVDEHYARQIWNRLLGRP